jgi:16S rRNA (guanine966-N2)-methyltransferase
MRIAGGTLRGRRLAGPTGPGTRPTAGRVKQALFNILADQIPGARFLDLYAGTGLIGLEALSRGAVHATFVESCPASCRLLKKNLKTSGYGDLAVVHAMTASRFLKQPAPGMYDVVFLDPPYHRDEVHSILPTLGAGVIISPTGVVIIEHFHKIHLPPQIGRLAHVKSYRYGDTVLSFYRCGRAQVCT